MEFSLTIYTHSFRHYNEKKYCKKKRCQSKLYPLTIIVSPMQHIDLLFTQIFAIQKNFNQFAKKNIQKKQKLLLQQSKKKKKETF